MTFCQELGMIIDQRIVQRRKADGKVLKLHNLIVTDAHTAQQLCSVPLSTISTGSSSMSIGL
jgi:hypothetical protein